MKMRLWNNYLGLTGHGYAANGDFQMKHQILHTFFSSDFVSFPSFALLSK